VAPNPDAEERRPKHGFKANVGGTEPDIQIPALLSSYSDPNVKATDPDPDVDFTAFLRVTYEVC
jgi:hypothetical protein